MFADYEERRESDKHRREQIRALPVEQHLAVEADLRRLADQGYREDELMWAYEQLLKKSGKTFPGNKVMTDPSKPNKAKIEETARIAL